MACQLAGTLTLLVMAGGTVTTLYNAGSVKNKCLPTVLVGLNFAKTFFSQAPTPTVSTKLL